MSKQSQDRESPLGRLLATTAVGLALWTWPPQPQSDPLHTGLWYFGAFCVGIGAIKSLADIGKLTREIGKLKRAFGKNDTKGSAGFLTERQIRKRKLHKKRKGSRLVGYVGKTPLWLSTTTAHLILGPSGTQKTTAVILNILMGCPESALITDIKGELWEQTRAHREREFKHRCVKIDPTDPIESVKVNPLEPAATKVEANDPAALTYVRGMALQLYPDPQGGGGANDVFYRGARELIVTVIFSVIVALPPEHRNLTMAYRALSDLDILHDLLSTASSSAALNGEIADMARSTHQMAFGDEEPGNAFRSFRINALQALELFGAGNYLAAITTETTFDFADLKEKPTSLYILIDFANSEVLGKFAGLLQWMASGVMVASGNNKPVLFVLDEFCNAPVFSLPKILTLLRSAGVMVVMATQDLDDIDRTYPKFAKETVLSEAHIKQLLGGVRSKATLEYISAYLGEYTEVSASYAVADDGAHETISRTNRRLLTEDEVRRLPDDAQLILYGSEKPILAKKIQVFAVDPWRKLIGINSIYGTKRKLLPVEARIRPWRTVITAHGTRLYRRMERKVLRRDQTRGRFFAAFVGRFVPVTALFFAAVLAGTVFTVGLPNLRWEYAYLGPARTPPVSYTWCRYVGPTSPGTISGPDCPLIVWRKVQ